MFTNREIRAPVNRMDAPVIDTAIMARKGRRARAIKARRHFDAVEGYVSHSLFDERIADEEGCVNFLEASLGIFDKLGEQNYALQDARMTAWSGDSAGQSTPGGL